MKEQAYLLEEQNGYESLTYSFPTKRYYQTLDLVNDPQLIEEYKKRHSKKYYWPEIGEGIRSVGILNMEIFIFECKLTMMVETPLNFEWDTASEQLAKLPLQAEWEEHMSIFQVANATDSSAEKWKLMERIFQLAEH